MFGHPNGITRSVSSKFYEPLMKARNLKAIYLNRTIVFNRYKHRRKAF